MHGSYSIPDYPASHGCVRVSTAAMDWIWDQDLMPMGTPVWVHGEIPA
ncbi:MAG: L,D-transpeptidase [Ilumatobacteraceae bacterium]